MTSAESEARKALVMKARSAVRDEQTSYRELIDEAQDLRPHDGNRGTGGAGGAG